MCVILCLRVVRNAFAPRGAQNGRDGARPSNDAHVSKRLPGASIRFTFSAPDPEIAFDASPASSHVQSNPVTMRALPRSQLWRWALLAAALSCATLFTRKLWMQDSAGSFPSDQDRASRLEPTTNAAPAATAVSTPKISLTRRELEARARRLAGEAATLERDVEIAAILDELAHSDPDAAAEFLRSLPETERRQAVAAVLMAAAREPGDAVQLANRFVQADPETARDHGYSLMSALAQAGEFDAALRFVELQDTALGQSEDPGKWVNALYVAWTEREPMAAVAHATQRLTGSVQSEALRSVAAKWAATHPRAAADYFSRHARQQPDAFDVSLRTWVEKDPAGAARWLGKFAGSASVDAGAAALATAPTTTEPGVALKWAQRISRVELRSSTLASVVRRWAETDPVAAQHYVQSSQELLPADRAVLLASLAGAPGD